MAQKKCTVPGCGDRHDAADAAWWLGHMSGHAHAGSSKTGPTMPNLEGADPMSAARTLTALGVPFTDITTVDVDAPKPIGTIEGHTPDKGEAIVGPVTLRVVKTNTSGGGGGTPPTTPKVKVPYLLGLPSDNVVRQELAKRNLNLDAANSRTLGTHDPTVNRGVYLVIPPVDTEVDEGSLIKVEINPEPVPVAPIASTTPPVKVPDLIGKDAEAARDKTEDKGLKLPRGNVSFAPLHDLRYPVGAVVEQDPAEDAEVAPGTKVGIKLNPPAPAKPNPVVRWVKDLVSG